MTKTIEVPVSLIQDGNIDAIRALLKQNLYGTWATHPNIGSGMICSKNPDDDGNVAFS